MYVCVRARVCAFVSVHYSLGYRLLLSPWELIREKLWLKWSRAGPFLFHDCHFRFSRHPIFSLSLSLFDVYPVHSRTYVWKMFFNRSTEASSILWISYAGDAYYASRGARGEGNIYRDISIGKFTGGRWWNDEVRGRLSWKEFEAHSSMWNSILYFLDRYPFAIGGGGDANIWKTIYSGKRWILSINIIARSRIFGLRRKNFSREIFASFLIPGFFFNSSEFFEIFFSYPPPLNCLNSWWNIIIIETWLSTLPCSSFSCSSRFVFASQKAFANEPIGMQSQSERIGSVFDLSLTVDSSNSFPTKQRRIGGGQETETCIMETSTSLFAPVNSDFDKLRVWFPTFHEIRIFGRNIHIPVPIFFPAFTSDFYLILRIEGLVQFRGSWLGFKVSTKWLNVLYFRKFKLRVTWLNTWFIVFRILSPSSRNRSCSGSVCNLKNVMRKHIWFELINKLYLLFYKRLRFIRFKDIFLFRLQRQIPIVYDLQ